MDAFYVPILKAKEAEFTALSHVSHMRALKTLPLLEIPKFPSSAKRFHGVEEPTTAYLDEIVDKASSAWSCKTLMIDPFLWSPAATIESGEHVLSYVCSELQSSGIIVVPVIGYERWPNQSYRLAIKSLNLASDGFYCIRLDSDAIDDAVEPEVFLDTIESILNGLGITPSQCAVLIDFADATSSFPDVLIDRAQIVVDLLADKDFKFIVTAACSIPVSVNHAVKKQNSTGYVERKEMILWQALRYSYPTLNLAFGDYGVRNPGANDDVIAPDANGKIRYTIDKQYFVVRGYSKRIGEKGSQAHGLCRVLIASGHFMGKNFSWGDAEIVSCSQREDHPGNGTTWIAIDTSHHAAFVVAEIEEFDAKIAAQKVSNTPVGV